MSRAKEYTDRLWNQRDFSVLEELVDKQVVIHSLLGDYKGRELMQEVAETWLKGFPDLEVTFINTISEGDLEVVQWISKGTHQGDFRGKHATGRSISYPGVSIYRFEGEKIVEYWGYLDMQHVMNQLKET